MNYHSLLTGLFFLFFSPTPFRFWNVQWSCLSYSEKLRLARLHNDDLIHLAISDIKVARECFNDNGNQDAAVHLGAGSSHAMASNFHRYTPSFCSALSTSSFSSYFPLLFAFYFFPPYFSATIRARCPYIIICFYLSGNLVVQGYAIWRLAHFANLLLQFTRRDGGIQISLHLYITSIPVASLTQNRLVLSPLQRPMTSPVSLVQSRTPSTKALAIPLFLDLPPEGPSPAGLACSPVTYSEPMLGNTFSPALKLTNRANGTSQMHSPKYEATSEKEGISS